MNRSHARLWWTTLAALVLPTAAVAVTRRALAVDPHDAPGAGAAHATAAPGDDAPAMTVTEAQRRMFSIARRSPAAAVRSPFYVPQSESDQPDPEQAEAPHRTDGREKAPELTSIVTGRETLAVINGKPRRVGDRVADDRTLAEIDAGKGTATLDSPTKGKLVLKLHRPDPTDKATVRESAVNPQ